ncbi:MAG: T9SS type A sorting domain-containing protein, partial [Flavobacteriales bacterium]|nr:T9SS type A sorting domain-containing protein [Flavobacteriales bacterium]
WLDCSAGFAPVLGENGQSFVASTGLWAVQITQGACVDTSACAQVVSTGAGTTNAERMRLFPVPASDRVRVEGIPAGAELRFIDALGQVRAVPFNGNIVDVTGLAPGAYSMVIRAGAEITVLRFVKE